MILPKRTIEQGVKWVPTLAKYGTVSFLLLCYVTEWKAVLQYAPYYNTKWKKED